ncbi:hypothetical protein TURU_169021 [Turdus rufiventris]|nr:hypothetical protein TURU_169021 [Turdus rufiventris]
MERDLLRDKAEIQADFEYETKEMEIPALFSSACRYIGYICDLIADKPVIPHCKPLTIKSVTLSPVPCFNKQRNGCRPFCDILSGETRILSTSQEYERMKEYRVQEGKVLIPLGATVHGDVVVSVYHMRSTIGGRLQAKMTNTQIFQIQFHTGFIALGTTTLKFTKPELDACDSPDKYPQLFHVILDIEIQSADRQTELTPPWENFTTKDINPSILFSSHQEHQDTLALAGRGATDSPQDNIRNVGQSAFFSSLSWQDQKSDKSSSHPTSEDRAALVHEESEQSDDELLSLSSQHSNASGDKPHGTPKHSKKQQEPPAAPPPEDVDLLGLDGSPMSKSFPSQPSAAPSNSELLNDLFGVSQSPAAAAAEEVFHVGAPGSVHSTPRRSAASASPSPRVGEGKGGLGGLGLEDPSGGSALGYPCLVWGIPRGQTALLYPTLSYSTLLNSTQLYSTLLYPALFYPTLPTLLHSTPLNSTQLYSTPLNSTQLYSTLLYPALFYPTLPTLLHSTLPCSTLFYPAQLNSTQLNSTLLNSTLLNSTQPYSTLLNSTLLYSILPYSTQLYSTLPYPTLLYPTLLY